MDGMINTQPQFEFELRSAGQLAETMFNAYVQWLIDEKADEGLEIYSSEARLSAPLGNTGYVITGRLDARAMRHGSRVVIDHKTVKSLDEVQRTAQISHQFLTYHLLEFLNDKETPIDSVMVNMFRRVDSNHETAKPPFFDRYEVRYNLDELRNHWYHVLSLARDISLTTERLDNGEDHHMVAPPSPQKSCAWDCSFRSLCPMMSDGSNWEGYIKNLYTIAPFETVEEDVDG